MISIVDCKDKFVYRLNSRNLLFGVYSVADNSFIGIREKFGYKYLEKDYHRELKSFGCSATPTECLDVRFDNELNISQDNQKLFDYMLEIEKNYG